MLMILARTSHRKELEYQLIINRFALLTDFNEITASGFCNRYQSRGLISRNLLLPEVI